MQHLGAVDTVLTFEELNQWFLEEAIDLKKLTPIDFDHSASSKGRRYPVPGGVTSSISSADRTKGYDLLKVDSFDKCLQVFQAMEKGMLKNVLVEVSICEGSCLGGPGMPKDNRNPFN
jgi:iron only hydrogenase large subunit-like protein